MSDPAIDDIVHYEWHAPPKFRHRYWLHALLFLATFATTTFVGALQYMGFEQGLGIDVSGRSLLTLSGLLPGLWYSAPVLLILGAHELGHYIACRIHDVDASLPFFIPAPLPLTGTFGAVIRIREAFPSKRALFDIGVAGPIAGFVMLVPLLFWGVGLSHVMVIPENVDDLIYFGEPLLYRLAASMHFGSIPEGYDVTLHPLAFAAWLGMLATALNLLPFGQLDGGHVVYALVKRRIHTAHFSVATLLTAAVLTLYSSSWISMLVLMSIMALVFGIQHPRVIDEDEPLDARRRLVAALALLIFIVCFTPVPVQMFFGE